MSNPARFAKSKGEFMDARLRHQVGYHRYNKSILDRQAPWLKAHQSPRHERDKVVVAPELRNEDRTAFGPLRSWASLLSPWRRLEPVLTEYCVPAPDQPRPLRIQHAYSREQIKPLDMTIAIDGRSQGCALRYAGCEWAGGRRFATDGWSAIVCERLLLDASMSDIECVLRVADAIMADRLVLLRYVRRSPGYWTEVTHCSTFDALVAPDDPALLPPRSPALDDALEAIIYTWTGDGDRYLIEPRYDSVR
jgi:hypothetical protein